MQNMKKIFFNILTRTSNRPNYFSRCCESIDAQSYKNFQHIVCTDDINSVEYVKKSGRTPIVFEEIKKDERIKNPVLSTPYNLYINNLYNHVNEGYIIFIDDDDEFCNPNALSFLAQCLIENSDIDDKMIFWKVGFPNDATIPHDFDASFLRPRNISGIGFTFHSKYLFAAKWDEFKESDFRVAHKLSLVVPITIGINAELTRIQRASGTGGFGLQDDKLGD